MTQSEFEGIKSIARDCPRVVAMGEWNKCTAVQHLSDALIQVDCIALSHAVLDGMGGIGVVAAIGNANGADDLFTMERERITRDHTPFTGKPTLFPPKDEPMRDTIVKSVKVSKWRGWFGLVLLYAVPCLAVSGGIAVFSARTACVVGGVLIIGATAVHTGLFLLDLQMAMETRSGG